ncbi:hypothetical protein [Leptolyngbya ohadii]|uniref:hypothetical protein n=1 Tax=Leptolyngbya ohadii TaxID=1962290 RepID=UPI00117A9452|nr:hypothetical protein [Leptolyngbya ohadii]
MGGLTVGEDSIGIGEIVGLIVGLIGGLGEERSTKLPVMRSNVSPARPDPRKATSAVAKAIQLNH